MSGETSWYGWVAVASVRGGHDGGAPTGLLGGGSGLNDVVDAGSEAGFAEMGSIAQIGPRVRKPRWN